MVVSLLDALRAGVAVANVVTKSFQAPVLVEHWLGGITYGAPVPVLALIDNKQQQVKTKGGVLSVSQSQLTFLDIASLVAATAPDGHLFDVDILTLPDGKKGTAMALGGFVDAGTFNGVITEVWL